MNGHESSASDLLHVAQVSVAVAMMMQLWKVGSSFVRDSCEPLKLKLSVFGG